MVILNLKHVSINARLRPTKCVIVCFVTNNTVCTELIKFTRNV